MMLPQNEPLWISKRPRDKATAYWTGRVIGWTEKINTDNHGVPTGTSSWVPLVLWDGKPYAGIEDRLVKGSFVYGPTAVAAQTALHQMLGC